MGTRDKVAEKTTAILVGSLQYSPIYKSHCCALGKQAESKGCRVKYLFSEAYNWMLPPDILEKTYFVGHSTDIRSSLMDGYRPSVRRELTRIFDDDRPDVCYMYNFHPFLNLQLARLAHRKGATFIQHVQEPYVPDKSKYKGLKKYWLSAFEQLQEQVIREADGVVISSKRSLNLFQQRYGGFQGEVRFIPLMYEDLGKDVGSSRQDRTDITFIGPPVPAKGTETFLRVVERAEREGLNENFVILTRVAPREPRFYGHSNLQIIHKEKISDNEVGDQMRKSKMSFTPYTVATQSSVVLTSFMYGTPALSTNVGGLPEFIDHRRTGYLLDPGASSGEWLRGITYINENLEWMSRCCRDQFIRHYAETNWSKYLDGILYVPGPRRLTEGSVQ